MKFLRILISSIIIIFIIAFFIFQKPNWNRTERVWELVNWNCGRMQVITYAHKKRNDLYEITNNSIQEIKRLDKVINENNKNSEAGQLRLELEKGQTNNQVTPELFKLINFAVKVSKITNGAFDITVGPLIQLWKNKAKQNKIPQKKELEKVKKQIGWNLIKLDKNKSVVKCLSKYISINLGAFSKGYAIDRVVKVLQLQEIPQAMVNIGGDLRCYGSKVWKIGIQDPFIDSKGEEKIIGIIGVKNKAIATSGHYRRYVTIKGKKYSHIINPRTGYPVSNKIVSVTVIADNAMTADAYATAFCVLPPEKSIKLADNNNIDLFIITQEKNKTNYYCSNNLKKYWIKQPYFVE